MTEKTWTCDGCGLVSEYGWSMEEAMQEAEEKGLKPVGDGYGLLCDDCYESFLRWFNGQSRH